ncbi:dual oxidase maturation factor 1-like [Pyxicephalus adspersus]|uniref:dual oxidase maturation factor 1-like n=1 Tax=Pyxicephalus adspersus TaxID=30357 RepID=UPI003B58CB5E
MHESVFPFYPRPRTPFFFDTNIVKIIILCFITAATLIIILPGIRGKLRTFWLVKVLTSLFIGTVILSVNFTCDWEVGSVATKTMYKSFSNTMVNASIGLWVGLRGLNITLTEEIIADSKLVDTKQQRRHRFAFCAWILSNVLFCIPVPLYGIYMMFTTSVCIVFSLISFATVRRVPMCTIYFGNSVLQTQFGFSFWISFATGKLCMCELLFDLIPSRYVKIAGPTRN